MYSELPFTKRIITMLTIPSFMDLYLHIIIKLFTAFDFIS